jgi:tetratricopeptide (TPR) repeat protein
MSGQSLYAEAKKIYDAGNTRESILMFEQARAAFLAEGNVTQAAHVANDLGVVYYLVGRREEAKKILQDALASFEQLGDIAGQAKALGNLAQVLDKLGDRANAERNYHRAGELFHQIGERMMEYFTYRALSQMQLQRGRWLEALHSFDRALAAKGGSTLLRWFFQIPLKLLGIR